MAIKTKTLKTTVLAGAGIITYTWTAVQGQSCLMSPTSFPITSAVDATSSSQEVALTVVWDDTACMPIIRLTLSHTNDGGICDDVCYQYDLTDNTTGACIDNIQPPPTQYYDCSNGSCIQLAAGVIGPYTSPNCDNQCVNTANQRWVCQSDGSCRQFTFATGNDTGFATEAECIMNCAINYACIHEECTEAPDGWTGAVYVNDFTCNDECCDCTSTGMVITDTMTTDVSGNKCYSFDNGGDGSIYINNDLVTDVSGQTVCPECVDFDHDIHIIIDRSASVVDEFNNIKDAAKLLLQNVKTNSSKVNLLAFNTSVQSNLNVNITDGSAWIDALTSTGQTSAMDNAVNAAILNKDNSRNSHIMIVISDGEVNGSVNAFQDAFDAFNNAHNAGFRIITAHYNSNSVQANAVTLMREWSAWKDGNDGTNGKPNDYFPENNTSDLTNAIGDIIDVIPSNTFKVTHKCCSDIVRYVDCESDACEEVNSGTPKRVSVCEDGACVLNLLTDLLINADAGGTWTYNGYSATYISNPLDAGYVNGNEITVNGDNPTINSNDLGAGYYSLTYTVTCGETTFSTSVILEVTENVCAGGDGQTTVCETETSVDIIAILDANSTCGVRTTGGSWIHNGGTAFNMSSGIFNPSEVGEGIYNFEYVVEAGANEPSYEQTCRGCQDEALVTVTVTQAADAGEPNSLTVCNI